jgi:DnaJ-class molecular chaperone
MFQRIAEAFSVLSDPQKREVYNHELKYGFSGGMGGGGGSRMFTAEINPHEIFNMLFGGGGLGGGLGGLFHGLGGLGSGGEIHIIQGNMNMGGMGGVHGMFHPMMMHMQHQQQSQYHPHQQQQQQQQQHQPQRSTYEPEIVLKMDSDSDEYESELIYDEPAPSRENKPTKVRTPELIEKTVHITMEQAYSGTTVHIEYEQLVQESDIISSVKHVAVAVTIPRGIRNNETITLPRIGNIGVNGACGDVRLTVAFIPHATFSAPDGDNLNIVMHKQITLKESLCGLQFEFTHLNGKSYQIINKQIGSVIQPESIKTINGLGFIRGDAPHQQQQGALQIVFHVMYPESISVDLYNVMSSLL